MRYSRPINASEFRWISAERSQRIGLGHRAASRVLLPLPSGVKEFYGATTRSLPTVLFRGHPN